MNPEVDKYIRNVKKWQPEMEALQDILLDCGLEEELKWRSPCYTFRNKNLVMIAGFKDHCALSFLKGVLLEDKKSLLVQPGENSQSVRFLKFNSVGEIDKLEPTIRAYIYESQEIEKEGLKVTFKKIDEHKMPIELQNKLEAEPDLRTAFEALTPGRQRGYLIHISGAKQSATRISRIENCIPKILVGKGFHDCTCGLSKRMPNCDGSHKSIPKNN